MVQTAFQREKFIKNGIPSKKLFIVPGITPSIPDSSESYESTYVSFVGRVSEEKGIKEFLEAARLLPSLTFIVVGSYQNSQAYLKASSPANVLWKGFLSGKDLDLIFRQSRIVVVPSKWYEGFPNVITQAMKHGKPVITSNLGAMATIIDHGENGLLVEPGDSIGLAKAIRELYKDTEKCNLLGANAKKKADTFYSGNKVYDDLIDLYSGLLKEKEKNSKKVLFILHYPPPVHGAAMVGQYIMESNSLNDNFDCQYINLGTSISVDEIGIGGWPKFKRYFKIIKQTLKSLYSNKPNLVYITLTASGAGFYKDAIIVMLAKAFGKKVVFHFHNKGISKRQDNWGDNLLYKKVFKKSEVILLSKHLYSDIAKYVPKEHIHYCANGIPQVQNEIIQLKSNRNIVQLLFLSNLIESKGVFVLLKACQLLQAKQLPFHCTFIGSEGDITIEKFQEKVNELGVNNCVHYAGKKYGVEKEAGLFPIGYFCFSHLLSQ